MEETEFKVLAKEIEVNVGDGLTRTVSIFLNEKGQLEIMSFNHLGDPENHLWVLCQKRGSSDMELAWKEDEEI